MKGLSCQSKTSTLQLKHELITLYHYYKQKWNLQIKQRDLSEVTSLAFQA